MIGYIVLIAVVFVVGFFCGVGIQNSRVDGFKERAEKENRLRAQWEHARHEEKVKKEMALTDVHRLQKYVSEMDTLLGDVKGRTVIEKIENILKNK